MIQTKFFFKPRRGNGGDMDKLLQEVSQQIKNCNLSKWCTWRSQRRNDSSKVWVKAEVPHSSLKDVGPVALGLQQERSNAEGLVMISVRVGWHQLGHCITKIKDITMWVTENLQVLPLLPCHQISDSLRQFTFTLTVIYKLLTNIYNITLFNDAQS